MEGLSPKERFLTFIPNCGHSGSAIANTLLHFLENHNIDICDCRGQSYDNAANMSGKYKEMQALILEKNSLSVFIPCCGHSLNLVGKAAASSCASAVHFFDFIQNIYTFFTASTERYKILVDKLSGDTSTSFYVPKNLNETRWSCRADATKAIVNGYDKIKLALAHICEDEEQKDVVKIEANKLLKKMNSIEIAFYALFWNDILERFNATNKILQDSKMVLCSAVVALKSLKLFVKSKRNTFEKYEEKAYQISGTNIIGHEYKVRSKTRNVRLNPLDYAKTPDVQLSPREKFRIESFIPVIDQLSTSLTQRISAYDIIFKRFGFINHLEEMTDSDLQSAAEHVADIYKDDLELTLSDEIIQFRSLIDSYKDDYDSSRDSKEIFYYKILIDHNFKAFLIWKFY